MLDHNLCITTVVCVCFVPGVSRKWPLSTPAMFVPNWFCYHFFSGVAITSN